MNASRMLVPITKIGQAVTRRQLSSSAAKNSNVHPNYIKIKEKYRHFQEDNGIPIHLKGGTKDKLFFGATLLLAATGLMGCFHFYYVMSFPKKSA